MKTAKKSCVALAIASGVVFGALSWWLILGSETRKFDALKAHALCVVDLIRRVTEAGGPVWLVKTLLWAMVLMCAVILWRVVPEVRKAWTTCFLETPDAALAMNRA